MPEGGPGRPKPAAKRTPARGSGPSRPLVGSSIPARSRPRAQPAGRQPTRPAGRRGRPAGPRRRQATTPAGTVALMVLRKWYVLVACLVAAGGVWLTAQFFANVPLPASLPAAQSSTVYAADGSQLALFHGTEDRTIVALSQISTHLQQAVVAAEDRTFFSDSGVSLRGTLRAFWVDITGRAVAQGGSTITQQYVRGVFTQVGHQRTITRKLKEATLAIKFERKYTKNQILEDYLNTVYFGRGAYGAQAAAEAYFNVSAADLTVSEASYLAGIIRGPEYYQPDTNLKGTTQIRDTVLGDLVQAKMLTAAQADAAKAQPLPFSTQNAATSAKAAYFIEYVRRVLGSQYHISDQQILTGGLKVYTTLDPKAQDAAEAAVSSTLNQATDPQVAMVSMNTNGAILAMVGGRNVTDAQAAQGFNFAYQQAAGGGRQAGSAFKPFTLAAFIQGGYSIASTFQAPPSILVTSAQCRDPKGNNWLVNNFNLESFASDQNITQATAQSINTVYAQLVDKLGPKTVTNLAQQIGGWTNLSPVCSITLGTSAVTPLEMARAYATFATQGQRPVPIAVTKVTTPSGQVLVNDAPRSDKVLDPNVANTVNQVLSQVLVNGTASGKGIGRPAAGKTGTTENNTDAWFVGYTPTISTAVWMGYTTTDPKTGQTTEMVNLHGYPAINGGTLPATIWQKYMKAVVAGTKVVNFVNPTLGGKVIGPTGAPCPAGVQPTADFNCLPAGAPCSGVGAGPATPPAGGVTGTVTGTAAPVPCASPSEVLPPDFVIPSPSPGPPGPSPGAKPHALGALPAKRRTVLGVA